MQADVYFQNFFCFWLTLAYVPRTKRTNSAINKKKKTIKTQGKWKSAIGKNAFNVAQYNVLFHTNDVSPEYRGEQVTAVKSYKQ